ncbi:diaminopimelate decarboxylase [Synoicihabitans lomoniglobus]|uniref:Diaminopimelate decarboxylase n=1 Tax=Synoicihabitans lomoniglobus TaxID=2909285 RepID=A0AAE9ZZC6_9BACT|nr:diaminopimelate decarboxylase [Opitutaceae bacterium LMO-M01]WED63307.1 diaminopimelate decarboxylase [Opitutaceae bacterium LMO-M01]
MTEKSSPFTKEQLEAIAAEVPTPFHVYDEGAMRANARAFYDAFSWVPGGFKNFFAVKALPNPHVMQALKAEGLGGDCSSYGELVLCEAVGITGEDIVFTSNDTPAYEFQKAAELGAIINLDDISHIDYLEKALGGKLPELLCFRYNPGPLKAGNAIIGKPEEAKYGFTREQLFEGYRILRDKGVKRFGLHTMVASNELNPDYFVETAQMLFDLVVELDRTLGVRCEFLNLGGGIGIPYRPEQTAVDLAYVGRKIREAYEATIVAEGLGPIKITMECGRMITGPYGYLVGRVLHKKAIYKDYLGLDASMANLMRPGMYGSYHHITVPGREDAPRKVYDITGSLCENNDKFAIDREIPDPEIGDLVVIHDSGAHGHSMGFNYNAKLRSAEVLWQREGKWRVIRRAETLADHFATLDYPGLS